MRRNWNVGATALILATSGLAAAAHAQHAAEQHAAATAPQAVEDAPIRLGRITAVGSKPRGEQPSVRGPAFTAVYDSITGCTGFGRFANAQACAGILDDGFFTPGPAGGIGANIAEIDFCVRPIVALPTITARITIWNTLTPAGLGDPAIVQSEEIFSETYVITGTAANTTPGLYIFTADVVDFVIPDDDWAIEIAFLDAVGGNILPIGQITTSFPGNACAATQPVVGANAAIFWADNDLGTVIGDGIRYEPYDAAQAGVNQGDAIAWGGATPADNTLALTFWGNINDPTFGACCLADLSCVLTDQAGCEGQGGTFTTPGTACTVNFCVPPPANDNCLNATPISGFGTFFYDNAGATQDGPADCDTPFGTNDIDNDVWFVWEAPCSGTVRLDTCLTTGTDDKFAVYSGTNCGDLNTQVACDDDGCSPDENAPTILESSAEFSVSQGTSYLFRIGNFPGEPGQNGLAFNLTQVDCISGGFCDADWCEDGTVGVPDIFCFLSDWFAESGTNGPARCYGGTCDVPAIFAFLAVWFGTPQGPCTP